MMQRLLQYDMEKRRLIKHHSRVLQLRWNRRSIAALALKTAPAWEPVTAAVQAQMSTGPTELEPGAGNQEFMWQWPTLELRKRQTQELWRRLAQAPGSGTSKAWRQQEPLMLPRSWVCTSWLVNWQKGKQSAGCLGGNSQQCQGAEQQGPRWQGQRHWEPRFLVGAVLIACQVHHKEDSLKG